MPPGRSRRGVSQNSGLGLYGNGVWRVTELWLVARVECVEFVDRHLGRRLADALGSARVVVLHGARQCGKTTLARAVAAERGGTFVTLDDRQMRDAALADPRTFLRAYAPPLVIDEVQIGGDRLVREIKIAVDEDTRRGRFLLTGSTNFLTVPTISESLAGRAVILGLWPFSRAELAAASPDAAGRRRGGPRSALSCQRASVSGTAAVVERWFEGDVAAAQTSGAEPDSRPSRDDYLEMVCTGGYPEVQQLAPTGRAEWFDSYVETVISRDIVQIGDIRRAGLLARLLHLAAAGTAGEVNIARWSQQLGADRATIESYLGWLRTVFLMHELPSWARNRSARVVRRPKLHLADSGLAAAMIGVDAAALRPPTATATDPLVETFAVGEIARQLSASAGRVTLCHYRDNARREADLILERPDGAVVAVEIKATSSPRASDLRHVAALRDGLDRAEPGAFRAGVLLHTGVHALGFGDRLHSVPLAALWESAH